MPTRSSGPGGALHASSAAPSADQGAKGGRAGVDELVAVQHLDVGRCQLEVDKNLGNWP